MILYSDVRSGSCRRVLTVIQTLTIDIDIRETDILKGETKNPEFLKLNPGGKLPVLVDEDMVLWEASAIMLYLVEKAGKNLLVPEGEERFQMLKWMFFAAEHFRVSAPIYFEENLVAAKFMGRTPDADRLAEADRRIDEFAGQLDTHLAERKFVLGDTPCLADIDLAAPLSQMTRTNVPYEKFANIMRWNGDLEKVLPAWKESGEALNEAMEASLA